MELKTVKLEIPEGSNLIFGQTHFIKTVEDLYEIMVECACPSPGSASPFAKLPAPV